jgi:hypothetical protein
MSKINQPSQKSSIFQKPISAQIKTSSTSGDAAYKEKGFYSRDIRLLVQQDGALIGTENNDNLLLQILQRDTVQVTSIISGDNSTTNG